MAGSFDPSAKPARNGNPARWRPHGAVILLILTLTSTAPTGQDAASQQPQFSTKVTQVEVYATVTGPDGRAVQGLRQSDFTVLEDDVPQQVTTFIGGDFPASVALAIDRSFSMKGAPLQTARTAARAFVASLRAEDRVMLISISGDVEVLAPLSTDKAPIQNALAALEPWSTTALHDALIRSIDLLEGETGRRAIVALSDGVDRYSEATSGEVLDRARRSDVLMYPIAIGKVRPPLFVELAAIAGGRSFHLKDPNELQNTLQAIAEDLRAQYLLGYQPSKPWPEGEEEWRSIMLRVHTPGVRVRARSGYSTR